MPSPRQEQPALPPDGPLQHLLQQWKVADKAAQIRKEVAQAHAEGQGLVIHGRPKSLSDPLFYPQHDARKETAAYKAVHQHLVVDLDLPCRICGVRNSILVDKAKAADPQLNPYAALQMETHHHTIEWALANAVDPALFNKTLRPTLAASHPDIALYQQDMTAQQIHDWVDHSPDDLWVLCDVHHRHKWVGIHEISYPLWVPQGVLSGEFERLVRAEEKAGK